MKKWCIIILTFAFNLLSVKCQIAPDTYWIQFTDKNGSSYSIDRPWEFLSDRAIERRNKQDISITEADIPVNQRYVDSLKSLGLAIHNVSKWFNGVVVISNDSLLLDTLNHLSFIKNEIHYSPTVKVLKRSYNKFADTPDSEQDYGLSESQIKMLNGQSLHNFNFDGNGLLIAVLDAGFSSAMEIESLQHLWDNNKIVSFRDFVKDSGDMFDVHTHGTIVTSIIAGLLPGYLHGTAPGADFALIRTENGASEYLVEEYNWISGAEFADSIGADIINSSLGYSLFDDSNQNHSYADMDGKTTPISIAARITASKGILVVTSAGNEGNDPWQYITAPADADSILAIGAVKPNRLIAEFSGKGPSSDGRLKPDVSAQGVTTYGQVYVGSTSSCNGTSCSSPVMAGMAACLWQSRPEATAQQIRLAIMEASDRYRWPDTLYGNGIPDMLLAQNILDSIAPPVNDLSKIVISPNPIRDYGQISTTFPWLKSTELGEINFYDVNGRLIIRTYKYFNRGITITPLDEVIELEDGYYTIRLAIQGRFYKVPFIKLH